MFGANLKTLGRTCRASGRSRNIPRRFDMSEGSVGDCRQKYGNLDS